MKRVVIKNGMSANISRIDTAMKIIENSQDILARYVTDLEMIDRNDKNSTVKIQRLKKLIGQNFSIIRNAALSGQLATKS